MSVRCRPGSAEHADGHTCPSEGEGTMRSYLTFCSLALVACTEAPRTQPGPPDPGSVDNTPTAADLSGIVQIDVDLAPASLAISSIAPKVGSTLGREQITIN